MTWVYKINGLCEKDFDHFEDCTICGWHIYVDLEGHYYNQINTFGDKWTHKQCFERKYPFISGSGKQ